MQRTKSGAVLTPEIVAKIKWKLSHGEATERELANVWDVSLWTIRAIKRGDTWGWVVEDPGDSVDWTPTMEITPEIQADMDRIEANLLAAQALRDAGKGEGPQRVVPPLAAVIVPREPTKEEAAAEIAKRADSKLQMQERIAARLGKSLDQIKREWNAEEERVGPTKMAPWVNAQLKATPQAVPVVAPSRPPVKVLDRDTLLNQQAERMMKRHGLLPEGEANE